ncbi:MAG: isochorismatase family protein [Chloroflexi bacterium]|nr:isochorismatase family protein [Chloroflexota bacterium]MCI0645588.1 isochorismatase family protein [Chloroflexota bacterium]
MSTALVVMNVPLKQPASQEVYQLEAVRQAIRDLLERARSAAIPVIYVQSSSPAGASNRVVDPELAPTDQDIVLEKQTPDPFYQTTLAGALTERGIRRLVMAGTRTELDVDTACRQAFSLGYEVHLAADGHSTVDGALPASQIIAHHNNILQHFATVAAAAGIALDAPPAFSLEEPLAPADLAAIRAALAEADLYERWLAQGDVTPFWPHTHPTRVTDALRQLWDPAFTPQSRPAEPAGWELGLARQFIQPLAMMPGFFRRTAISAVAQAINHLLQSPTNPFSTQTRKLAHGLWSYDAKEFRLIYMPRTVRDSSGRERKYVFLVRLAPALPRQNPFA